MNKLKKILFVPLVVVFFILHTLFENYHHSLIFVAAKIGLYFLTISAAFILVFYFLFKDFYKSSLFTFFLISFNLFFGSLHDFLKTVFKGSFITKYTFLLIVSIAAFSFLYLLIKKTKKNITYWGSYFSLLCILLIVIDIAVYLPQIVRKNTFSYVKTNKLQPIACDSCKSPDIYLIVADEYAGKKELADILAFDNAQFENELIKRDFRIINNSISNYNATAYSMASLLNMNYIKEIKKSGVNHKDMLTCINLIENNCLTSFLIRKGYAIINNSPFDINKKKRLYTNPFFVSGEQIFTGQTFTQRLYRDIGYHFISSKVVKQKKDRHKINNLNAENSLYEAIAPVNKSPRFVYTHFLLPHHPYYFDSSGKEKIYNKKIDNYPEEKTDYIQYLIYTNKKLLTIIDHIQKNTKTPPIIILLSDHGYRQFTDTSMKQYQVNTLNAVFLPNGNYNGFYENISHVNLFRVLLNSQFGQNFPILKDSVIILDL